MKQLRTIFPYGLNDRCDGKDWTRKECNDITATIFNKIEVLRTHRGSGKTNWSNTFSVDNFLTELRDIYYDTEADWMFYCRKTVMSLSKKRLKTLSLELVSKTWDNNDTFPHGIIDVLQDLIDYKLHRPLVKLQKPKVPPIFMKIYFHNKGIEQVNLQQLMRQLKDRIPSTFKFKDTPMIIYKRSPTIARKIFNYKVTVNTLNCRNWVTSERYNCDCKDSKFCDPNHGHIMTGNLGVISNDKLRSLLTKGPNYREKERINWKKVQECIDIGIDDCISSWAKYEKVDCKVLSEWKISLKDLVKKKIDRIIKYKQLRGYGIPITLKTLNRTDVQSDLADLHNRFVFVPTDKAQNNISIICKKFYIDSLLKEVAFEADPLPLPDQKDNTYIIVNDSIDTVVQKHIQDVKSWNGAIINKQAKLPFLYWTPKMHKNPTKKRFIANSASCTTKNTSATITLCLKLIQQAHKIYCDRIKAYTGFNFMWITQNSMELQHTLQKKGRNLATYDFSTLYTSIPHNKLKDKLSQVIRKRIKG